MTGNTHTEDQMFMAACLRLARRHRSQTMSNPSVGTLLVQHTPRGALVVGSGITARGGRPHAEPVAIEMAGDRAKGATAYVSLEPCAHHGATPPCAQALIDAGVRRVVTAWTDPDHRVDGKGHDMLRAAGIEVTVGVLGEVAAHDLAGYLTVKKFGRPQVTLKLAVSRDGRVGVAGQEVAITGQLARNAVHRMRAESEAILVGRATVVSDDPQLTCRLPGLENRSPARFVLDTKARLSPNTHLARTAQQIPTHIISAQSELPDDLAQLGVRLFAAEEHDGRLALPEILEDMANRGIATLMVEGGAQTASAFLEANLVDEIALFTGTMEIGDKGIPAPMILEDLPHGFEVYRELNWGDDRQTLLKRT